MTRPGRKRKWWYLSGALVVAIVLGGLGVWYLVFRDDAPAAVGIHRATESLQAQEPAMSQRETAVPGSGPLTTPSAISPTSPAALPAIVSRRSS